MARELEVDDLWCPFQPKTFYESLANPGDVRAEENLVSFNCLLLFCEHKGRKPPLLHVCCLGCAVPSHQSSAFVFFMAEDEL